jgi:antitoxin ParD1/3/4
LRILEDKDSKLNVLRQMLTDGEESGKADHSYVSLMAELDAENYI